MANSVLRLHPKDNVLVALVDLRKDQRAELSGQSYVLVSDVAAKHKFATEDLATGAEILMYGVLVGKAQQPIRKGEVLTTRNMRHDASSFHQKTNGFHWNSPDVSAWRQKTFLGYHRSDGQVGTRNFWLVVPLVFCENRNIGVLKQAFEEELGFAAPQIYRRQVAELARLYKEGKSSEISSAALSNTTAAPARSKLFENVDGIRFLMHEGG